MTETFETLPTIPLFLDARSVRSGSPSYIGWEAGSSTQHHFLISGNSGSGKSTHLMLCLAKVQKYMPRSTRLYRASDMACIFAADTSGDRVSDRGGAHRPRASLGLHFPTASTRA